MRTFELHRIEDETGISGTGIVAQGVEFDDGTCALRWMTEHRSSGFYETMRSLEKIHGHGGKTKVVVVGAPFERAMQDAYQDSCENAPFACVGGLGKRAEMKAPDYITPAERRSYVDGYRAAARLMYGEDWQTCSFGWAPAMTIGEPPNEGVGQEGKP
jgi:hypothetical protein